MRGVYGWVTPDGTKHEQPWTSNYDEREDTHDTMAHELGYTNPGNAHGSSIRHALEDGAVRYIRHRDGMEIELRHDHDAAKKNAIALLTKHKPKAVWMDHPGRVSTVKTTHQGAVARLSGLTAEPKTDIARAREFPFGESFNVRIDPEKLSLASAYHDEHQGFHTFDIKHGDEIIGTLSGNHAGDGRLNIRTARLDRKRFGSTTDARGALGTRGVMKLGRELRRHGYHTVWSNSRATGMRSGSRFRSGGTDYSIVPDIRLPEGALDEREYSIEPVDAREVLHQRMAVGSKKEMRRLRRIPAEHWNTLHMVHVKHAGETRAEASYALMNGPELDGPENSHAHILWAKNMTAPNDLESSAQRPDPGAFRALLRHIKQAHPTVRSISAERVTGRHRGDRMWTVRESIADALILQKLREAYRPRMPLRAGRSFEYKQHHVTRQASWISPSGEEHRMPLHGATGHLTWLRDNLDKVPHNLHHPKAEKMAKLGARHPRFDYQPFDATADNMVMAGWIRKAHKDAYQVAPGQEQRVLDHVRARHPDVGSLVMDVTNDVAQRYGRRDLRTTSYRYDVATGSREEL